MALLLGNFVILISIRCSPLCHQPMYYFLSHLSFMGIWFTSCVTPKFIGDLLVVRKTISYANCILTKCHLLMLATWVGGAAHSFPQFSIAILLPFCGPNQIDHYFCDIFSLLKVACTDIYIIGVLILANSGIVTLVTFMVLFVSYVIILLTVRAHSAEGRQKALDKVFALFYTIIAPLFNPLIYTLRKAEMKNERRKVWWVSVSNFKGSIQLICLL
ncbi:hypothetical protein U0070_015836, partial [Myodes glareolus]